MPARAFVCRNIILNARSVFHPFLAFGKVLNFHKVFSIFHSKYCHLPEKGGKTREKLL